LTVLNIFIVVATAMLLVAAIYWREHGALNKTIKLAYIAASVIGCILSAKVLSPVLGI
jgi:uncharacterized membrane protein YfcA